MVDFSKPVQTRDGRKVRVLCMNRVGGLYPIIGLIDQGGIEETQCWTSKGVHAVGVADSGLDLVNVPPQKVKVEVRLYRTDRMTTGLAQRLGVVAILDGETFGPAPYIASTTIEMEYEAQS